MHNLPSAAELGFPVWLETATSDDFARRTRGATRNLLLCCGLAVVGIGLGVEHLENIRDSVTSLLILVVGMVTILGAMMAWASCVADYEPMENLSGLQAVTDLCTQSSWAAQWRTSVARDRPLHGVDLSVMEALANRQTKHEAIERAHGRIG